MTSGVIDTDDDVDNYVYIWPGPPGAHSWWPRLRFDHWKVYVLFVSVGLAAGFTFTFTIGRGSLPLQVLPPITTGPLSWLAANLAVRHVDRDRPFIYHWQVLLRELRTPRPERGGPKVTLTASPHTLLTEETPR